MALAVTSPPKGSRAARTRATEDRILAVALESFGTKGFDSVSLDDLAADLGITKQAILYHWSTKRALLDAVIDRAALELIIEFDGALSEDGSGWCRVSGASHFPRRHASTRIAGVHSRNQPNRGRCVTASHRRPRSIRFTCHCVFPARNGRRSHSSMRSRFVVGVGLLNCAWCRNRS